MSTDVSTNQGEVAESYLREFLAFLGAPLEFSEDTSPGGNERYFRYIQGRGDWQQTWVVVSYGERKLIRHELLHLGQPYREAFYFFPHRCADGKRIFIPAFLLASEFAVMTFEDAQRAIRGQYAGYFLTD